MRKIPDLRAVIATPSPWRMAADVLAPLLDVSEWYKPNPDDNIRGRARAKQRPPLGVWFIWLIMSGRGFGKSRTATEWIDSKARSSKRGDQVLVAGRTPSDVRDYELKGPGGLLTHHSDIDYQPANRLLVWPNGVEGLIRSGANPEEFRGFSGEYAMLGEFAAWDYPEEAWNNLMFGVRERDPQIVIATTPRPLPVISRIMAMPGTRVTTGSSYENRANLSERWVAEVLGSVEGSRLARQEVYGELLGDVEGALWRLSEIDRQRVRREAVPELKRIVVGVDPQGIKDMEMDTDANAERKKPKHETGIVVAGLGVDDHVYVLLDASINGTPAEWGRAAVSALDETEADKIVGEKNYGGDMVEHTIRTVRTNVSFGLVNASRGKRQRAEPVSALYEQGCAHHVGAFKELEDEMCGFTPETTRSPNRMDALVWAVTELLTPPEKKRRAGVW